ncbi:MAG: endonuclease/exonuclease/phosphatase family protein [Planctomycetota bacterium]|jgi:endonuclease/exonuclease/phosphatase family metal-dependent hydrolase|nr:endonuclease/exonuclease/phosphatase family protein [Planctomycetota bacterium]
MLSLLLPTLALCAFPAAQDVPPPPSAPQEAPSIRLVSWNIENFFDRWDDPYRRDQITKPAYASDARMERVAKVLQALDADIVALQEVENRWHLEQFVDKYLVDMGYEVVLFEGNDTRGIDVALLSRIPLGEVTSYRHIRFTDSEGKEQQFRRDLLRVRVEGTFRADVYVVHLKSQWGDEAADVVRESESAAILEIFQAEMKGNPFYRGVVCGDFNEVPELPTLAQLREGGLVDPMLGTERYSYNKEPYLTRIDFAMCSPHLAKTIQTAEIVNESPVEGVKLEAASDHYPLLVTFRPIGSKIR